MQPTVYQKPELRDANDNIIQQGAFGKNTALANSTNDGWIDYVANNLEFLYDLAKDEVVPVPSLPASGQTNKTYLLTTTGVSYRWSGTEWVAVSSSEAVGRAESAANLAEQWATKTDGTVDGTEYSAKYYAEQAEASADDAQDTADDMADHLAQIDKNTGGVAKNSKRISNIEKLLQGNLYDYDTDDDSAYTKTVPAGALPYAGVEKLGGKTLVWNQLNDNSVTSKTTGVTIIKDADNRTWTVNGLSETNTTYNISSAINYINGHKYLLKGCPSGGSNSTYRLVATNLLGANDEGNGVIVTCSADAAGYLRVVIFAGYEASNLAYTPQLHDLTALYGAGNEPSTVAEFEAMFPASYYPYNAGTLLSAGVTGVKSQSANLLPTYTTDGSGNGLTWKANTDGSVTINGTASATTTVDAPVSTWEWDGSTPCWLSGCPAGGNIGSGYSLRVDDASHKTYSSYDVGNGIAFSGGALLVNVPIHFRIVIRSGVVCNNLTFRPMLNYGESANAYTPYIDITTPIPAEVRALEGYGWSAGNVSNYIDFERKVFVQNVGSVVIDGTNNAVFGGTQYTNGYRFNTVAIFTDAKYNGNSTNILPCPIPKNYDVIDSPNTVTSSGMALHSNYIMYILTTDSSITTAAAINTWLQSHPQTVYYELATPIETDISVYLTDDNLIEVESGGTLTFPNANGDDYHIPVPSTETYMIDLQEAISNG